jgi:6-phosphogluconolactonase (cycloisomerase 2 family)
MTTPSIPPTPRAALPLVLVAAMLAGCPDTTESAGAGGGGHPAGPVGRVKLVQTLVSSDDPDVDLLRDFVVSPNGKKVYVATWNGNVLSFDRSPLDGSLARAYASPVYNASGLALTPDGEHLYATGSNYPFQLVSFDIDPVTGEPTPKKGIPTTTGGELAIAAGGTLLFQSQGGSASSEILAYRIDPTSGALTLGAKTSHDSPYSNFTFLADDEHGTLYAERTTGDAKPVYIVRYAVDPENGGLTEQAETSADLAWAYVHFGRCPGTTRMYVAQQAGNIAYADISGTGLSISTSSGFTHPDLAHVWNATLSPDCKNLYAVTVENYSGSLVVLARDDAGDLTWLQTIEMGPHTAIPDITKPLYAVTSPDGKNVYVDSYATDEGFVVFQRDTTGEGFH